MNEIAKMYRAEILRAVLGSGLSTANVANLTRLNQIAEHLAECENAQTILRAKGHGGAGMTFVDVVRSVPDSIEGKIKRLFSSGERKVVTVIKHAYPDIGEVHDAWPAH